MSKQSLFLRYFKQLMTGAVEGQTCSKFPNIHIYSNTPQNLTNMDLQTTTKKSLTQLIYVQRLICKY